MLGGVHGDEEAEVYKELCEVVEEWIDIQQRDEDPLPPATAQREYSGKFLLRVGTDLHKQLAIKALQAGESLNSYCLHLLKGRVGAARLR
jgi:predicted HicB family RNase H-like nuclease